MTFPETKPARIISIIVLSSFIFSFCGLFDIAIAAKNGTLTASNSEVRKRDRKEDSRLEDILERMRKAEERIQSKIRNNEEIDKEEQEIEKEKAGIDQRDTGIRKRFKETEEKIKDLPEEIKQRHRDFVKKYEENYRTLKTQLNDIKKARTKTEKHEAHRKAKDFLEKVKPPKRHIPLDPHKLPHRTPEPKKVDLEQWTPEKKNIKLPKRLKKAGNREHTPLLVAANGALTGLLEPDSPLAEDKTIQLAMITPKRQASASDADLAETPEVRVTPAIRAKAEELGNKPVKLYNWIRNNIDYVPTYGSIQGADMCLQTKQCNDIDTASLLIALLRVSNIPARYSYGVVERKIEDFMNWMGGFTDPMAALNLAASAGIPVTGQLVGDQIKYVRLEHIWVEAYIDYIPSRGARHRTGKGDTWIPLDPSYKQYTYTSGLDIQSEVPFDAQAFIDRIQETATINEEEGYATGVDSAYIQQTMQDYQAQVEAYIDQNHPDATVGDVLGKKEIIKEEFPFLLGTLHRRTITKKWESPTLPANLAHRITFQVYKDVYDDMLGTKISVTKTLPELAGKRISLNYVPATDADKAILDSYVQNNAPSVPAYLVKLKAELKVEDEVIATGPALTMGTDQILNLSFSSPEKSETETHLLIAGDHNVIGLNVGGARKLFEIRSEQGDFSDALNEMLYQTILTYWAEYDSLTDILSNSYQIESIRVPSEGLSSYPINIKYVMGIPYQGYYSGIGLDIKRDIAISTALNGENEKVRKFNIITGMKGSELEGNILDQLYRNTNGDGLSAVKIFELANSENIPFYYIEKNNINDIIGKLVLSAEVINNIKNVVNAGRIVMVPGREIEYFGWSGTAYIAFDAIDGTGAYIIEGGTAGGFQAKIEAAYAAALVPYTQHARESLEEWIKSKPTAVILRASNLVDTKLPPPKTETNPPPPNTKVLGLARLLALAFAISILIDEVTDDSDDDIWWNFWHYTTPAGRIGILTEGYIKPTDYIGDLGVSGAYMADIWIDPSIRSNRDEICLWINREDDVCWNEYTSYVTVKVDEYIYVRLIQGKFDERAQPGHPSYDYWYPRLIHQYAYPEILGRFGPLYQPQHIIFE